jgi:hypothetical protein
VGFVIGAIFIAPFVLFSATSGQLADKLDKGRLMRFVKDLEIVIMVIAATGFLTHTGGLLYVAVFLMGLHSTLFGPVKYAYLPQHLTDAELTGGNGLVEMGTFVAILLGTMAGGILAGDLGSQYIAWSCLAVAVTGRAVAQFIPASPPPEPDLKINWNPFSETWHNLKIAARQKAVFNSLLGISWLWFFGSVFLTSFTPFSLEVLHGDENVVTLLLRVFSFGIGAGSLLCERLSGGKIEIGLVPFGSIGMTLFAVDLWLATYGFVPGTNVIRPIGIFLADWHSWRVMADLFFVALFGGLFSVPLYALIQARAEPSHRARIIAANNILNALFIIVAALMSKALLDSGVSFPELFLVVGLMNAAVAGYIYMLVPEFLMRFICWLLIHTVYRLEKRGLENIPRRAGRARVQPRELRRSAGDPRGEPAAHPLRDGPQHLQDADRFVRLPHRQGDSDRAGEGRREAPRGGVRSHRRGAGGGRDWWRSSPRGASRTRAISTHSRAASSASSSARPAPVVPLALKGLWGSFFSRRGGKAMTKPQLLVSNLFKRISLEAGGAVAPAAATPEGLQLEVQRMRGDWK